MMPMYEAIFCIVAHCASGMSCPDLRACSAIWSSQAVWPTSVEKNQPVAAAVTRMTSAAIPNHCGRATTAANVSRGDVRMPRNRARRPGPEPSADGGKVAGTSVIEQASCGRNCNVPPEPGTGRLPGRRITLQV